MSGQQMVQLLNFARQSAANKVLHLTAIPLALHSVRVIFLTHAAEERSPYVHETVHIIAWNWHTMWIKEGLAVFLNDHLGGYPAFPSFGRDIDDFAKSKLAYKFPLRLVGQNGIPKLRDRTLHCQPVMRGVIFPKNHYVSAFSIID